MSDSPGAVAVPAGEVYCRVVGPAGEPCHARAEGSALMLLDEAPWSGGRPTGAVLPLADARFLPPSAPRNILGLANAYAGKEPSPPPHIRWFAKSAGAAATHGDVVEIPPVVRRLKTEAEVVIVVGRRLKNASPAEAQAAIFGYAPGNELFGYPDSYREAGGEPSRPEAMLEAGLKLGDNFAPFGPFIVRGSEWRVRRRRLTITDLATGAVRESVSDTAGLLYPPPQVLSELSRVLPLHPGDVVFSGANQAFVVDAGEEITVEFEGLGRLTNLIRRGSHD